MPSRSLAAIASAAIIYALLPARGAPADAPAKKPAAKPTPKERWSLAPLPPGLAAVATHAPYGAGDCSICHQSADPKAPGPVVKKGSALCFECHSEVEEMTKREHAHPPAVEACTACHNPHDARQPKMLHADVQVLCTNCHADQRALVESAPVKHGALSTGRKCANCHNPHGSSLEKLLIGLPFDLCMTCHGVDGVKDWTGKTLVNMKKWLEDNKNWHVPVASKDCSACHRVHGSENFRLLAEPFPPTFYAPFDLKNYALCFSCHDEHLVLEQQTTSLTGFRNGSKNLHFVHVNRPDRGRTCRACHEVHASNQAHHVREGVPFGARGWILKLNHTETPTGGACAKTCHETRSYDRVKPAPNRAEPVR
jgi:predicted CXXCH cytochrome family protein